MWESDTERKSDAQTNKISWSTSKFRENLSVLTCHNYWRTTEVPLAEKILRALEQFFMKSQIDLGEKFSFQWSHQGRNVGHHRTEEEWKRVGFRIQYIKFYKKWRENFKSGVIRRYLRGWKGRIMPTEVAVRIRRITCLM